ncbi:MAG: 4-hydroxy-3-methylbut-2-enyl diphosphate reductase, partial [Hyphomonadaceae bacterium]|nr:4-hydroxy-3-methylbut-2-enyl diphosphate reductase [Clostridia bacterium]
MQIFLAKTAGFCFGVNRAVEAVYDHAKSGSHKTVTLGPIIHNQEVVNDLMSKGIGIVNALHEIDDPEVTVILRTHGVGKKIYEILKERNLQYEDLACPFVKKIHHIVERHFKDGWQIVIIGDALHPEIIGINGWCEHQAVILNNIEDCKLFPSFEPQKRTCVVAQTTINREKWDFVTNFLKNTCTNIEFFDTICSATNERQTEAAEIAKKVDVMFVVGDKNSSNTGKLFEICKKHCEKSFLFDTAKEMPVLDLSNFSVGITAGASTPASIIKEVIETMEEQLGQEGQELSFADLFENSLVILNTGEVVTGTVIRVTETEVFVDLGFKSDGLIRAGELTDDPAIRPKDFVQLGDKIEVFVIRVDDGEGNVLLSKKKVDAIKGWKDV